jgi:sugar lactone lactonase YvrE
VGCNGDSSVKSIDLETKKIKQIARFSEGLIDGIEADSQGQVWISHNEGRLYQINPEEEIIKMVDSTNKGIPIANFLLISHKNLIIIPTFIDNRILIYRYSQ